METTNNLRPTLYALVYSSHNESDSYPYVECLGVYDNIELARQRMIEEYENVLKEDYSEDQELYEKESDNYRGVVDAWGNLSVVIEINEIDHSRQI